jgi:hypothetical protein
MSIWKYILIFLTAIVILVIVVLSLQECEPSTPEIRIVTHYEITPGDTIHDTTYATVYLRPHDKIVEIPKYVTLYDSIHDTLRYLTPAFTAKDTAYFNRDTLYHSFLFPEMCNEYEFRSKPDTTIIDSIFVTNEKKWTTLDWVLEGGKDLGLLVLGIFIGKK